MKKLEISQMENLQGGEMESDGPGWGQRTMNCMTGTYGNKGWASVGLTLMTAFIPETAVGIAAACAIKNY